MLESNRAARLAEAEAFTGPGDCYIHAEMKDGKHCELIIAGGGQALVFGIAGTINRLAEKSGTSFQEVIEAVQIMHENA